MDFTEKRFVANPRLKANPISKLFFCWIIPLFRLGSKKALDIDDMYNILPEDDSQTLGDHLEVEWEGQLMKARRGKKPRFYKAIISMFRKKFLLLMIAYLFDGWIVMTAQPLFLRQLIRSFRDENENSTEQYLYAVGLCVTTFLRAVVLHPAVFEIFHIGMQCRVASSSLIYRKALKLSKSSQLQTTIGQLSNALQNLDVVFYEIVKLCS